MGRVNGCLKCIFIFFNVLYAILGVVLIVSAVQASSNKNQLATAGSQSTALSLALAIGVFGISCLGIYAGCSEKPLVLKIFAGFMGVGMIIMLIFGILVAVGRNEFVKEIQTDPDKVVEEFMKNPEDRKMLDAMQKQASCCGLLKPSDWGQEIPNSCACVSQGHECQAKPQGSKGPDQVYKEPCIDVFIALDIIMCILMGLIFGLAATAMIGLLISLLMIRQVNRYESC